jgi:hypothetical protein
MDIPFNTKIFADLLSVDAEHNQIFVKWEQNLLAHQNLFERNGQYKFDVLATSNIGKPATAQIGVEWNGAWDQIKAWPIN